MSISWFLPTVVGVIWFGGCIVDFAILRPRKDKKLSWIELLIAVFIGIFLVTGLIPTVDHFGASLQGKADKSGTANKTSEPSVAPAPQGQRGR